MIYNRSGFMAEVSEKLSWVYRREFLNNSYFNYRTDNYLSGDKNRSVNTRLIFNGK